MNSIHESKSIEAVNLIVTPFRSQKSKNIVTDISVHHQTDYRLLLWRSSTKFFSELFTTKACFRGVPCQVL